MRVESRENLEMRIWGLPVCAAAEFVIILKNLETVLFRPLRLSPEANPFLARQRDFNGIVQGVKENRGGE